MINPLFMHKVAGRQNPQAKIVSTGSRCDNDFTLTRGSRQADAPQQPPRELSCTTVSSAYMADEASTHPLLSNAVTYYQSG